MKGRFVERLRLRGVDFGLGKEIVVRLSVFWFCILFFWEICCGRGFEFDMRESIW